MEAADRPRRWWAVASAALRDGSVGSRSTSSVRGARVFLSTGIGHTLQQTACDEVFYGKLIGYYWNCYTIPPSADKLDESQRDKLPREYAINYIENHKSRLPLVVAARIGRMWEVFKPGQTTAMDWWIEGRGRAASWISLFCYYAMLPFAVVGIVTLWRRKITIIPILAPAIIATFAAAITFGLPRYRAPAEVGLVFVAAVGIAAAWTWLRGRRAPSAVPGPERRVDRRQRSTTRGRTSRPARSALHTLRRAAAPEGKPFIRGLVALTLVAAAVRVMNVLWWRPTTSQPGFHGFTLTGDSFYYHWQANALAEGHWYVDPFRWANQGVSVASAAHPPLYTLYLAFWSRIGVDTVTGHRLASCLLGVAAVVVIALLAYRLAGPAAGLVAGGIAALYPQLWINDGVLLSESVAVLVIACALHAMYSFWQRPTMRNAIVLGVVCGLAALARNELLLLFIIVVIPLALRVRDTEWRPRIRLAIAACIAGAVVIAPWALFNLSRFDEPTLTSSSMGSVLSAANCDSVYYGSAIGYYDNCFKGPWPTGDESVRDLVPRDQALDYMRDHITRLPVVALARVGRMWGLFDPGQTTYFDWSIEGRGRAPSWIGLFAFYLLIPFAVGGLIRLFRTRITILPLLAAPIILTLAAAITFGVTRYRAPAEVSIVVAAAIGVVSAAQWLGGRRPPAESPDAEQSPATLASP